jgi:DNA invertase Pin-like site-specific DNA recombinase
MRTVAYLRVTTGSDDLDGQRAAIIAWAEARAETIAAVYQDGPRRGFAGRTALLRDIEAGRVWQVVVARPCRLAATLPSVLAVLRRFNQAGASVIAANSPHAFAHLVAALDALDMVRAGLHFEATAAGREMARRRGTRLGRPPVNDERAGRVRAALRAGASVRQAAQAGGVGVATAFRARAAEINVGHDDAGAR